MSYKVNVLCDCGCHNGLHMHICADKDDVVDSVYIMTTASPFFTKQCGIFGTIKNRIKAAWFMLRGKEYMLHDLILESESWNEFVNAVNKLRKEENNG